ncbi:MAG: rod-binding protein [Spirochaetaceae bacterium]|jgi:flagellar protein FlgJ|nr:rod-binding protein [Spirochaetaceae bacterium]
MAVNAVNNFGSMPVISDPVLRQQSNEGNALFDRLLRQRAESGKILPAGTTAGNSAKVVITTDDEKKLFEQCQALETFLMKTLVNGMRKTVMKSELIDAGFAGEMYEDMLYDEYAQSFTKNAGFGLAEMAYLELSGRRGQRLSIEA